MKLSLEAYCTARVVLAKAILNDPDPRLKRAYHELKQFMIDENRRALRWMESPALLRRQAD